MIDKNTTNEEVKGWVKNSVTLKLIIVIALMLLLLIPTSMIKGIIYERQALNNSATTEVSAKWASAQVLNGPVLTIPLLYEYQYTVKSDDDGEGDKIKTTQSTKYLHILPEDLQIDGVLDPESLKRGIYEVIVYKSLLEVEGTMNLNQDFDQENLKEIKYDEAFLTVGITDMKGIQDKVVLHWGDEEVQAKPGSGIPNIIHSGITFKLPNLEQAFSHPTSFSFSLNLQGSGNISFIPMGNNTEVNITSPWNTPSFNGKFIPDIRKVTDAGFTSTWKVLELNRSFPQHWMGETAPIDFELSAFGVDLLKPIDDYQKAMRSAKYAAMTIALTFLIFFLVEVINKTKIHPFQYALVGLALCLFYVLLISISEHSNFNIAYLISSIGTIMMISLYSISIFNMKKLSAILTLVLTAIYAFLFTTLQLTDYALLMGSVGLTLMLGATMYFTRNINWYGLSLSKN